MDKVIRLLKYLNVQYTYLPFNSQHHLTCAIIFKIHNVWFIMQCIDAGKFHLLDLVNGNVHKVVYDGTFNELEDMLCSFAGKERELYDLPLNLEPDFNHSDLLSDMED